MFLSKKLQDLIEHAQLAIEHAHLAGRPCSCGSGLSFGSCCHELYAAELAVWRHIRQVEHALMEQIARHARQRWPRDVTRLRKEAARLFFLSDASEASNRSALPAFERWFAFRWVPDGADPLDVDAPLLPEGWPNASLGVTWLTSVSSSVSDFEQEFILTAANSPHSLLLIESVEPGWSLVVRDLLTGRQLAVVDPDVSRVVQPEHILFSAVLTLDAVSTLLGCASYACPSELRRMASAMRLYHANGAWLTRGQLCTMTEELSCEYRSTCDGCRVGALETFGERREPLVLRWNVSASLSDAFERVRSFAAWYGEEEAIQDETGPDGIPHLSMTWYEPPPPPELSAERRAIGYLYLDDGRLTAHVGARAMAERLIKEVRARLGSAATLMETRPDVPTPIHAHVALR